MQNKPKQKLKFIYWFAYYNLDSPSVRYRAKFPLDLLKLNYGVGSYFVIPGYSALRILYFFRVYFSALLFRKSDSMIVVQRVNSNFIYGSLLKFLIKMRNSNTLYDIDDADYLVYPPATIYYFIKNCSAVSVGSAELKKNLSRLNKHIVLNTSPTPDLQIIKQGRSSLMTIGWIGDFAGGHKEALVSSFFPALKALPFKVRLTLIGVHAKSEFDFLNDYFSSFMNVELDIPGDIDWQNEEDIQNRISKFDIGIATLLNTELHRSKSAFKLKQYLNNGVPVLSSSIPENNCFVNGKNGFLCDTPDDFKNRIIEIKEMSNSDYNNLSETARKSISKFNLTNYSENLLSFFSESNP